MKTVNDLVRIMSHYKGLVQEVADAERALHHGGSPATLEGKEDTHTNACLRLAEFLNEDLATAAEGAYL